MKELPADYSIQEIQEGVAAAPGGWVCLECQRRFYEGEVYPDAGRWFAAEAAAHRHAAAHGDRLQRLLAQENRYITLTAHQKKLLCLLASGASDAQIAAETGVTAATVRRQRFAFREKAKRATLYLALYGLVGGAKKQREDDAFPPLHEGVKMLDERFDMTQAEYERVVKNAFESLQPPRLKALPAKEKKKLAVLYLVSGLFHTGRDYTEKEVNALLKDVHPDEYVTLRRYLIEYGFMNRVADGSRYWRS